MEFQRAAMRLGHPARNRESESSTRTAAIEASEPLEDSFAIGGSDTVTLIGDADANLAFSNRGVRGHETASASSDAQRVVIPSTSTLKESGTG